MGKDKHHVKMGGTRERIKVPGVPATTSCAAVLIIITTMTIILGNCEVQQDKGISKQILENWASKFGGPLFEFGRSVTKYNELQGRFQSSVNSDIKKIELDKLILEMTNEMNIALKEKVEAIRKIMNWAEEKALEYYEIPPESRPGSPSTYYNAKKLLNKESDLGKDDLAHLMDLTFDHHFGNKVNTSYSSIHVPTSIYEKKEELLQSIGWSSNMDSTFISNYQTNPTLSWQYFGSSSGFLRQYPAMKWPNENTDRQNPDLYDCRTRPWYVLAANSPKNVIILQDVSGSMTGLRREIAKHVVSTILDTLTENDFVNVYNFSEECHPLVPCYKDRFIQANLENIRDLKEGLDQDHTAGVANFSAALNTAFDLLEKNFNENDSSNCNQAIMIITDGAPYPYEDIFKHRQNPMHMARVFTYLIGRDVTDKREVMFMACANNGYYTHVSTLSEVQEQVLKYIPVMSRPMVMHQQHIVTWTPVYADIAEVYETDWSWQNHNYRRQYRRSERYKEFLTRQHEFFGDEDQQVSIDEETRKVREFLDGDETQDDPGDGGAQYRRRTRRPRHRLPPEVSSPGDDEEGDEETDAGAQHQEADKADWMLTHSKKDFRFVVSASIPVFDLRNSTAAGDRIAILLGVAGTDVPIKEIKKIVSPFKLGVNGYAYMINNNGYVVFHPDWRPVFRQELLKPNYNTVDFTEVELIDNDAAVKNNDSVLLDMRQEMIEIERGYRTLKVRVHQNDFKRVTIRKQKYEYMKVRNTPYTLGLVVPHNMNRFVAELEIRRDLPSGMEVSSFFGPTTGGHKRWMVNPDWTYCEYIRGGHQFDNKEDLLIHFLQQIQKAKGSWAWRNTGVGIRTRHAGKDKILDGDIYSCEKELVQSLVFDANATEVFTESKLWKFNKDDKKLIQLTGATMAFIATRSGLTRWIDFVHDDPSSAQFMKNNSRATEELWYKRAVERYEVDPESFVFSVPFDAGTRNDSKVTATRAVYVKKSDLEAPVAVVGVQYRHDVWAEKFFNITSQCVDSNKGMSNYVEGGNCKKTCESAEYDCFVLDDNGFILYSEVHQHTGRFFGEIDGMVMNMLVNSDVYKRVRVVDYQAVCFQPLSKSNFGNFLRTPLDHLFGLFSWALAQLAWFALQLNLHSFVSPDYSSVLVNAAGQGFSDNFHLIDEMTVDTLHPYLELASINKTRLRPCDKETSLYTYGASYNTHNFSYHGLLTKCGHAECNGYFNVHFIPHTNLILVVTDGKCQCVTNSTSIELEEVNYFKDKNHEETDEEGDGEEGSNAQSCRTPRLNLFRKRPDTCINYNANENEIHEDCGGGSSLSVPMGLLLVSSLVLVLRGGGGGGGHVWI